MPYLVVDLEMSGPDAGYHEIIQVGAILLNDNWSELGRFLTNVYPENEEAFTSSAEKVHGLSLDDLAEAPMIYEVLEDFDAWIRKMLKRKDGDLRDVIICGQSVIHDVNFLKFAYRDENMEWPFSNKLIDLHTIAFFTYKIMEANSMSIPKSLSLKAISSFFGFEREGDTHNALEDCHLTMLCLQRFFKIAAATKVNQGML
ncbi:MAG TPA: 3'-5' exonuclease [Lentimicrobium sp.]|nr:3'-5' exonuclease [Lentimicrobium sp.]